jgi:hypothetical protein
MCVRSVVIAQRCYRLRLAPLGNLIIRCRRLWTHMKFELSRGNLLAQVPVREIAEVPGTRSAERALGARSRRRRLILPDNTLADRLHAKIDHDLRGYEMHEDKLDFGRPRGLLSLPRTRRIR